MMKKTKLQNAFLSLKLQTMLSKERIQSWGVEDVPRLRYTIKCCACGESYAPPTKLHIVILPTTPLGPNPETNPALSRARDREATLT